MTRDIDKVQLDLVYIILFPIQREMSVQVSFDVARCIAFFCGPHIDGDGLVGHSDKVEASSDSKSFRMTKSQGLGHVFWKIDLFGHFGSVRAWSVRIDGLKPQKTRWKLYIARVLIGIQDVDKTFPDGFVGDGRVHLSPRCRVPSYVMEWIDTATLQPAHHQLVPQRCSAR